MKPLLASHILNLTAELRTWNTSLIVPHEGKVIDISSATHGKNSTIPDHATFQPKCYPNKTVYRFDRKFKGIDALNDLSEMLHNCCEGCEMVLSQSGTNRSSSCRDGNWTFSCKHGTLNSNFAKKTFVKGEMKLSNSKIQTLKHQKSAGSTYKGIEGMYSKSVRNRLREKNHLSLENEKRTKCIEQELNRRTAG